MSVEADIYNAFAEQLASFAAIQQEQPELRVAWPGVTFTPPDAGMWLEASWHPNRTENYGIGNEGPSTLRGFGQVNICIRPGSGTAPLHRMAGELIRHFAKGTALAPARVYQRPYESNVLDAPDRTVVYVTIPYRADVVD
jgi:hypothetical protein